MRSRDVAQAPARHLLALGHDRGAIPNYPPEPAEIALLRARMARVDMEARTLTVRDTVSVGTVRASVLATPGTRAYERLPA